MGVQKVVWNTMSLKDETTGYQVLPIEACCFKYAKDKRNLMLCQNLL